MKDEKIVENGAVDGVKKRKHGPGHLLVGKIARLPKAIRELLNRRLDDGEAASSLVAWLNELPPVKDVLASYFGGAAITQKNISNWRLTGYKRWQERQEILGEVRELAEEASDINETSGEGLMRMTATLACTKLLRLLRDERATSADVVKIGFAIAALNNVELSRVRVKHEERRLDQKDELVTLAWDKHLRDCAAIALRVLKDAQAKAVAQAPVDYSVQIELIGRRMFGHLWRKRKLPGEDHMPGNVGDEEPEPESPGGPGEEAPENTEQKETKATKGVKTETQPEDSRKVPEKTDEQELVPTMTPEAADKEVTPATASSPLPANPYAGKTTQQLIAEAEDNYAREKAARLNRRQQKETGEKSAEAFGETPKAAREARAVPARELSAYEKALLEGKTHLEAMYAQATPVGKPKGKEPEVSLYPKPNPLDGFSDPVNAPRRPIPQPSWNPFVMRPLPGSNSLG